jgi:hypothetical protein
VISGAFLGYRPPAGGGGPPPPTIIAAPAYLPVNAYKKAQDQAAATAAFVVNPDGTWTSSGDSYTPESGLWFQQVTAGAGNAYDVRITVTLNSGTAATVTNAAANWIQLNAARTLSVYLQTVVVGVFNATYTIKVEMRPTGGGATVSTKTFTLKVDVEAYAATSTDTGGGAGCPLVESVIPGGRTMGDVRTGDLLLICDPNTGEESFSKVTRVARAFQPCVRLHLANGVTMSCSTSGPIATDSGTRLALHAEGLQARSRIDGLRQDSEVVRVEDIGTREVVEIEIGENTVDGRRFFWVGDAEGKYGLHHNRKFEGL